MKLNYFNILCNNNRRISPLVILKEALNYNHFTTL